MQTPSFKGQKDLQTQSSDYNSASFHIRQEISKLSTTTVVKIIAVNVDDKISPVGRVDVQPIVDQMDGRGQAVPHGIIYNVPYMRMQGGANAIIIDPQIDDIGLCCFSDRDISRVKETKKPALPGSKRMMSMADALYIGGILNGTPERYIIIDDAGIDIIGGPAVNITADSVVVTASEIILDGDVTGPSGVPPKFPAGIDVNSKIIDEDHLHIPGAYNIGGTPVTGNSGSVV